MRHQNITWQPKQQQTATASYQVADPHFALAPGHLLFAHCRSFASFVLFLICFLLCGLRIICFGFFVLILFCVLSEAEHLFAWLLQFLR